MEFCLFYHIYDKFEDYLDNKGFEQIGRGSFRKVFWKDDIVIKIPLDFYGISDNIIEARAWKKYKNKPTIHGIKLAPCRLLSNYCLMMRYVRTCGSFDLPHWSHLVDGCQVGKYKDRYVAYDYALDLVERHQWEQELNLKDKSYFSQHCDFNYDKYHLQNESY